MSTNAGTRRQPSYPQVSDDIYANATLPAQQYQSVPMDQQYYSGAPVYSNPVPAEQYYPAQVTSTSVYPSRPSPPRRVAAVQQPVYMPAQQLQQPMYMPAQQVVRRAPVVQAQVPVTKEIPKFSYDVRTVLVPKSVNEDYVVMETRMVAISIPVSYQRSKWISVPREISIPRPMIEKRVVRKMVPKVIQVEEEYEIDCGMTELATVFVGADINNDGRLSMSEWQSKGYDSSMFAARDADGDGELTMAEMSAYQGDNAFLLPGGFKNAAAVNNTPVKSPASGAKSGPQTPQSGLVQ